MSMDQWEASDQVTWYGWTNERPVFRSRDMDGPMRDWPCPAHWPGPGHWGWADLSSWLASPSEDGDPPSPENRNNPLDTSQDLRSPHLLFENWVRILSEPSHCALSHFPWSHDLKLVVWVSLNSIKHLKFWNDWRWKDDPWDKRFHIFYISCSSNKMH